MYYNANVIINKLEQELKTNYYELCCFVASARVDLTPEEINNYLQDRYNKEKPGEMEKLNKLKNEKQKGMKDAEKFVDEFMLTLSSANYCFEPYTLEYFKNYISILKTKCNNLIKIIDGLVNKSIPKELLKELDINLNKNGEVLMSDIIRIIEPFIYNYKKLSDIVEQANNLETYFNLKISLDSLAREGINEEELYPKDTLQNQNYEIEGEKGFVPYTMKQKKILKKEENRIVVAMCDIIKNLK